MRTTHRWACAALMLGNLGMAQAGSADPYFAQVWADAQFDTAGKLKKLQFAQTEAQPAELLEQLRTRLASARIPAIRDDQDQPAEFDTGMLLSLEVRPGTPQAQVAIKGMKLAPRVLEQHAVEAPKDVSKIGGWDGSVTVECEVRADGICHVEKVDAVAGVPESVRRWAKLSMETWRFVPQRVNGQPVPGKVSQTLTLKIDDSRPEDFRVPKLDRILQNR